MHEKIAWQRKSQKKTAITEAKQKEIYLLLGVRERGQEAEIIYKPLVTRALHVLTEKLDESL